ncbi:MAG: DUF2971 domain-containing protein [Bacteroidales bacterium]|nr:DUF2971 domain-containing protein [Bacteroidales bacterium]
MHINEVNRILTDSLSGQEGRYEIKRYCDHICCESDFVLLRDGLEYAYLKFDETGQMNRKAMGIHEDKMGTASFYVVLRDTDAFIPTSLSCKVYPRNNMKSAFECDTDCLLEKLEGYLPTSSTPMTIEDVADFFEKTYSSLIRGRMRTFMSRVREETILSDVIEDHGTYFMLTPQYERLFFCSLLGSTSGTPKRLCRYTSLASLFRTLSEKQQSMCSTVCMNDKTENEYARNFISEAFSDSNIISRLLARTSSSNTDTLSFILSGSRMSKKDDLNMWRLYGDDSKGVCLWYKVDDELPEHFFLARVSYAKNGTHPELTYLASKMGKSVCGRNFEIHNLSSWLHFFKPSEYAVEEEVRLLYELSDGSLLDTANGKWIHNTDKGIIAPIVRFPITKKESKFPLALERIVLGPNLKERGINKDQLLLMCKYGQIKVTDNFEITCSDIESYR